MVSSVTLTAEPTHEYAFQSRNREAYGFKSLLKEKRNSPFSICFNLVIESLMVSSAKPAIVHSERIQCFNLVIERLMVSSSLKISRWMNRLVATKFQSRNREAYGFKTMISVILQIQIFSFNLVIERLMVSRL